MRSRYVIVTVVLLIIGFGVKVFFSSNPTAEAEVPKNVGMNIFQMHLDYPNMKDLPVHEVKELF